MKTVEREQTIQELINQGNKLKQEEKLDEAISTFQQAIELDSNCYEAYHFLGETFSQKDELNAAANYYQQAIDINPDYFWSYHCLGQVLFWQGKLDEAIEASSKAVELLPSHAEFKNQLQIAVDKKKEQKTVEPLNIENLINQGTEGIYSQIAESFYWQLKQKAHYPLPPQRLIEYCGSNNIPHYIDNMLLYSKDIIQQCMLKRNHQVLEIGCGAGRIANGLFHYLNKDGQYLGVDVNSEIINWCKKFISNRNSNFQFQQIPAINDYYYQKYNNKANHYNFDFLGDRQFDCVFAVATFNHLRLEDTQQYLQEIGKRLKANGVAYFTFFVIDKEFFEFRKKTKLHSGLRQDSAGVWYGYERQSSFTGYEISTLKELLDDANLRIITYHPGSWAQKKRSRLYQDWLLVEKNR